MLVIDHSSLQLFDGAITITSEDKHIVIEVCVCVCVCVCEPLPSSGWVMVSTTCLLMLCWQ